MLYVTDSIADLKERLKEAMSSGKLTKSLKTILESSTEPENAESKNADSKEKKF